MTEVDDGLDSLKQDVRHLGDSVLETLSRVAMVEAIVKAHDARFDDLQHMITVKFDNAGTRLQRIDFRLDAHDDRFDRVDFRLNCIDGRLDGIDGRLDGIDGRLDAMHAEFGAQFAEILARLPQPSG